MTGETLDAELVNEGCREDIDMLHKIGVYEYVERSKAERDPFGKLVGVRWVKVNKGTSEAPNVRYRLVAQKLAGAEVRDDLFAGTPPLAAMRYVLSEAASRGGG